MLRAQAAGFEVAPCGRSEFASPSSLAHAVADATALVHCAGLNRGDPSRITEENTGLARLLSVALPPSCRRVTFANSVSAGDGTAYGIGKTVSSDILRDACEKRGIEFVDVRLPNLYGEGGRPRYNSVTATFVAAAVEGQSLNIVEDQELRLTHVTLAADVLLGSRSLEEMVMAAESISVGGLRSLVLSQVGEYRSGLLPALGNNLERHVFNMIRDLVPVSPPFIQPKLNLDKRGWLFEGARHKGAGQIFFSESVLGARRGDHYHTRKFERFMILSGSAILTCKDLLGRRGQYDVRLSAETGQRVADMHTFEAHTLKNIGSSPLLAAFWISEHFDESDPDTIPDRLDLSVASP